MLQLTLLSWHLPKYHQFIFINQQRMKLCQVICPSWPRYTNTSRSWNSIYLLTDRRWIGYMGVKSAQIIGNMADKLTFLVNMCKWIIQKYESNYDRGFFFEGWVKMKPGMVFHLFILHMARSIPVANVWSWSKRFLCHMFFLLLSVSNWH